jgi:hypothetical protein
MIRPLLPANKLTLTNYSKLLYSSQKLKAAVYLLPVVVQQQFNTHHPYGINDGSMVQAKGYQIQTSAGVFAKIGPLSVQLRPEYVFADNQDFQELSESPKGSIANVYNAIDLPARYGTGNYSKLDWGQSSIRLNAGAVSAGISTENLWWGPGNRNSLLMSNNAKGFEHVTFNTTRPVKTFLGAFEVQVIGGRLKQSGVATPTGPGYRTKPKDLRYISGMALSYQPKWVPNLYLGFDRSFIVTYKNLGNKFSDYFPIFASVEKSTYDNSDGTNREDEARRDQYISFFTRFVIPETMAEFYFEYGRNDHSFDLRDGIVEPEHSRAYVVGFRKLIPLKSTDEFIQMGVEITQLEKTSTSRLRANNMWYVHGQVPDGYTNEGQVLGAGIGPGSNMQSLDVSWVKGLKRIGLQFERLANNNDLFYNLSRASGNENAYINRNWVDLSVAGRFAWNYKKFIINSQLTYIRSLNYQYQWEQGVYNWNSNQSGVNNVQLKMGVLYNW